MYVILTSKPGQFRTEVASGLRPLESYDYLFYGETKAHFVIAELLEERTRIRVIEDDTVLGGILVAVGDFMIDATVRLRLERLRDALGASA